jgi:hypothetical protein
MNGARNHITDDLTIVFDTEDLLSTARFVHSINNCTTQLVALLADMECAIVFASQRRGGYHALVLQYCIGHRIGVVLLCAVALVHIEYLRECVGVRRAARDWLECQSSHTRVHLRGIGHHYERFGVGLDHWHFDSSHSDTAVQPVHRDALPIRFPVLFVWQRGVAVADSGGSWFVSGIARY